MFRCWKSVNNANINIKLQGDRAVVSYSIDPRHSQKAELHFKLTSNDVDQSIIEALKREVIPESNYNLTIEISSLSRKDSTEHKNITHRETSEILHTFITIHLSEHLRKHEIKEETQRSCAIL